MIAFSFGLGTNQKKAGEKKIDRQMNKIINIINNNKIISDL